MLIMLPLLQLHCSRIITTLSFSYRMV